MGETADGSTVGPIIFSDQTARRQLLQEGEVVTFRKSERTTGQSWWRESRFGPKQGDVEIQELGVVNPRDEDVLNEYQPRSGFPSVTAWQQAIRELNGSLPDRGVLYHVTLESN